MKYEEVKTNIKNQYEDLHNKDITINNSQLELTEDITAELLKNHQLFQEKVSVFDQEEQECKDKAKQIQTQKSTDTNNLIVEYEERFNEYNNLNDLDDLNNLLKEKKHNDLLEENQLSKKLIQENTYKINAINRDTNAREKEISLEKADLDKTLNSKINELKRKIDFETKKIQDQATKDSAPLDRELLEVNETVQIKTISKEINNIRKRSLEDIYAMKKEIYQQQESLEVEFELKKIEKDREFALFVEEQNKKIAELQYKIHSLELENDILNTNYDLNIDEELLNKIKENKLALNEMKKDHLLAVHEIEVKVANELNENALLALECTLKFNDEGKVAFTNEKEKLNEFIESYYLQENEKISNLVSFLEVQVKYLYDVMELAHLEFVDSLSDKTNGYVKHSIFSNMPEYEWQTFDFKIEHQRIAKEIEIFEEQRAKRTNKFFKEFNSLQNQLQNTFNRTIKLINKYWEDEINYDREFMQKFLTLSEEILSTSDEVYENRKENIISKHNNYVSQLEDKLNRDLLSYESQIRVINLEYDNNILEHNNRLKQVQKSYKKIEQDNINIYNQRLKEIEKNINSAGEKFKNETRKIKNEARAKYAKLHAENDTDLKEKLRLL